ncbi:MAG: low molecular weight protein-tyrosine-phosphatase [Peptococcaceae bacterium]|nr:low molecular weight protein-tyrosine-phosphatase [Peptococcaceae bacterium]
MEKVLFVCHGNICGSAMAESMFRQMLSARHMGDVLVDSAATSQDEIGHPMYPPAQAKLTEKGIAVCAHQARPMTAADYAAWDWLISMDAANMRTMARITGGDPAGKMHRLLELAGEARDIDDPWYTGDFEKTFHDLERGLKALLTRLEVKA